VALDLSQGRPRFYIMRLEGRGLGFDRMARHDRVTQCLGTTDGRPWLIAVAPASSAALTIADIRAFRIPGPISANPAGTSTIWSSGPDRARPRPGPAAPRLFAPKFHNNLLEF
jgi:hypothetical protein